MRKLSIFITFLVIMAQQVFTQENDPYLWLENVDDKKSLQWVEEWNKNSLDICESKLIFVICLTRDYSTFCIWNKISYLF